MPHSNQAGPTPSASSFAALETVQNDDAAFLRRFAQEDVSMLKAEYIKYSRVFRWSSGRIEQLSDCCSR